MVEYGGMGSCMVDLECDGLVRESCMVNLICDGLVKESSIVEIGCDGVVGVEAG